MPQIPDEQSIGIIVPSGQKAVARVDPSGWADGGMKGASKAFRQASEAVSKVVDKRTRYQSSKADADMQELLAKQNNAYRDDPEYGTIKNRWNESVSKGLSKISSQIEDPAARNLFNDKYRGIIARDRERISNLAWDKEVDFERSDLTGRLRKLSESAVINDMEVANITAGEMVDSAIDMGYVDNQTGADTLLKFRNDVVVRKLDMMAINDPDAAAAALDEPWATHIPDDKRLQLQKKYLDQSIAGTAQAGAEEMVDRGLTLLAGWEEIDKMYPVEKDVKRKDETKRRFENELNARKRAVEDGRSSIYNEYTNRILTEPDFHVDDIPRDALDQLDAGRLRNLYSLESGKNKQRTVSDPGTVDTLNVLWETKQYQRARHYFESAADAGKLSGSDFKAWSQKTASGLAPEIDSDITDVQFLKSRYPNTGDAVLRDQMLGKLGEWRMGFTERHGYKPDDAERAKAIVQFEQEYDTSWWWGGKKRAAEMDEVDWTYVLESARDDHPDTFNATQELFQKYGIDPTEAEFMEALENLKSRANAGQ